MVLLSKVNADIHRTLFNLSRIRKVVFSESLFFDLKIDVVKLLKVPLHLAEEAQANSLCIDLLSFSKRFYCAFAKQFCCACRPALPIVSVGERLSLLHGLRLSVVVSLCFPHD